MDPQGERLYGENASRGAWWTSGAGRAATDDRSVSLRRRTAIRLQRGFMPRDVEPAGRFGRDFMATRPPPSDDSDTASKHSHAIPRRRARYSRYAKATFKKDRRLNIRLSSKDLEAIQKRALAEGLPYQTLIASLLHKYAAGASRRSEEWLQRSRRVTDQLRFAACEIHSGRPRPAQIWRRTIYYILPLQSAARNPCRPVRNRLAARRRWDG